MVAIKDIYNKVMKDKAVRLNLQVIWQHKRDFTWYDFADFQLRKIRDLSDI